MRTGRYDALKRKVQTMIDLELSTLHSDMQSAFNSDIVDEFQEQPQFLSLDYTVPENIIEA